MKRKIRVLIQFVLNPRFLLCFGLAWLMTNGWAYILLLIGSLLRISWMIAISGAYMALLWFPFTPEKLITWMIAMVLLKRLFPNDRKTLGVLKSLHAQTKEKIEKYRDRKGRKKKTDRSDNDDSY